ncbi:MAG: hypothetical protein ACLTHL_11145 [Collinsella sp.]
MSVRAGFSITQSVRVLDAPYGRNVARTPDGVLGATNGEYEQRVFEPEP